MLFLLRHQENMDTDFWKMYCFIEKRHIKSLLYQFLMECVQVSTPTIGIKTFFQCYSEIRMRTIDVALSAHMNDRAWGPRTLWGSRVLWGPRTLGGPRRTQNSRKTYQLLFNSNLTSSYIRVFLFSSLLVLELDCIHFPQL